MKGSLLEPAEGSPCASVGPRGQRAQATKASKPPAGCFRGLLLIVPSIDGGRGPRNVRRNRCGRSAGVTTSLFSARDHEECGERYWRGEPAEPWEDLLAAASPQLKRVADAFVELQEARHQADYDLAHRLTRTEVIDLVDRVESATAARHSIRKTPPGSKSYTLEARIFLAALLVHDRVTRR